MRKESHRSANKIRLSIGDICPIGLFACFESSKVPTTQLEKLWPLVLNERMNGGKKAERPRVRGTTAYIRRAQVPSAQYHLHARFNMMWTCEYVVCTCSAKFGLCFSVWLVFAMIGRVCGAEVGWWVRWMFSRRTFLFAVGICVGLIVSKCVWVLVFF